MTIDAEAVVRGVPLFAKLDRRHQRTVAKCAFERSFAAGETIITQGEPGLGMFMIASGAVEVVRTDASGEHRLGTHGPGGFFGEIALLTDQPRTATVRAIEPTTCLVLTAWNFRAEINQSAELAGQLLRVVAERLSNTDKVLLAN